MYNGCFARRPSSITPERRKSLERTAIRIFYQLHGKEERREKLSPKEFELKCVVDDLLVRMLGGTLGGSDARAIPSVSPLPDAVLADDAHSTDGVCGGGVYVRALGRRFPARFGVCADAGQGRCVNRM